MKSNLVRLFLLVCSLGLMLPALRAEDLGAVKARMNQRLGDIDRLKASGAVGENLRGFLEVRDGGGSAASVVASENADRETVYAAIAKQTGSSPEAVGRARARQIAGGSAAGVWLQHEDGSWHKK
ncbi:MAG: YdbL family protein [Verrucomicrobia bacterium]|nr:YdbL family protein [Verrucomicrobiota bacterium]